MHHSIAHADAETLFRSFRYNAHPMSILSSAFAALGSFYEEVRFEEYVSSCVLNDFLVQANPSLQGEIWTYVSRVRMTSMPTRD